MTKVEEAIMEIDQTLEAMADEHEGLRDFNSLVLSAEAKSAITTVLADFDVRFGLLNTARQTLVNLMADGHPTLPPLEVSAAVLTEIEDNSRTVSAAVTQFTSGEATELRLSAGVPEAKRGA